MAKTDKVPEWKTINAARNRAGSDLESRLRTARLARDAALPPVVVVAKPARKRRAAVEKQ